VEAVDSGSNGLLVPPGNRAEFSSALDRLFSESGLRSRLVENARRTLQTRFQWEPLVDRTERILAEAAAGRRSA
jgi:glycosyltransferase involved in cell wall biosynthesis